MRTKDGALTKKQLDFCEAFGFLDSPTHGKLAASVIKAGYSDKHPSQQANTLMNTPKVKEHLKAYYDINIERYGGKGRAISNLEYHRQVALAYKNPKVEAANNAQIAICKLMGLLKEEVAVDREKVELDETQRKEVKEYIKWRMLKMEHRKSEPDLIAEGSEILEDSKRQTEMSYESKSNE